MNHWKTVQAWWAARAPREQRGLFWAGMCVAALLTWWLLLAPPLRVLRAADLTEARLVHTLDQMQQWQLQAKTLRAQPLVSAPALLAQLRGLTASLGPGASLQVPAGSVGQVTLNVKSVPAAVLADWLADPTRARLQPVSVHLARDVAPSNAGSADGTDVRWSGSLQFQLPESSTGAR